jgi:peptidase E
VHREFDARWRPADRPALARQSQQIQRMIERTASVLIAGGHVAVLLNRLALFGMGRLLKDKHLVGWSAGAMALTETVVLFHDHPPQGRGSAEVFERGLAAVPGLVALPHAASRLALDREERLCLFARRFAPSVCVTLDQGAWLGWRAGRIVDGAYASRVTRNGRLHVIASAA